MNELALYRKYRPEAFREVVGQEEVVRILTQALKEGTVAHAYLFAGPRGTGKTSVARILARELGAKPEDIYEIDAASNRGIDEIRELREAVKTYPFSSPYKIYIIDEVHMLTKEAFNALLKTLEEPPSHVIFILATTEGHKLPATIISRCQELAFRPPSLELLRKHLTRVAKEEGYELEPAAGELLALLGDGSYRDALGALQKAINLSKDKRVVADEIATVLGAPKTALIRDLILAILDKNTSAALEAVTEAQKQNYDLKLFLKLILRELRAALLLKFAGRPSTSELTKEILAHPRAVRLADILRELLAAYTELERSPMPELALELSLLKLEPLV